MKRLTLVALVFMMMFGVFSMDAQAAARENVIKARFETFINSEWNYAYDTFKAEKADGDIRLIKDICMTYEEVGINVFDVCMHIVLEDDEKTIEFHSFYDAVEEEWTTEYFKIGDERISVDEFEELYPELFEECQ